MVFWVIIVLGFLGAEVFVILDTDKYDISLSSIIDIVGLLRDELLNDLIS